MKLNDLAKESGPSLEEFLTLRSLEGGLLSPLLREPLIPTVAVPKIDLAAASKLDGLLSQLDSNRRTSANQRLFSVILDAGKLYDDDSNPGSDGDGTSSSLFSWCAANEGFKSSKAFSTLKR